MIDPNLPCGHPRACLDTKTNECGWCCESSLADQAHRERDAALQEASDERAARRVQAKDQQVELLLERKRGYDEGRKAEREDVQAFAKSFSWKRFGVGSIAMFLHAVSEGEHDSRKGGF